MTTYDIPGMVQSTFHLILRMTLSSRYQTPIFMDKNSSMWFQSLTTVLF